MSQFDPLDEPATRAQSTQLKLPTMILESGGRIEIGTVRLAPLLQLQADAVPAPSDATGLRLEKPDSKKLGRVEIIDGEELVHVQRDVIEENRDGTISRGILFLSNFRLLFQPDESAKVLFLFVYICVCLPNLTWSGPQLETIVPMCSIARIEKRRSTHASDLHSIDIVSKSFRRVVLSFVPHTRARRLTNELLTRFAFPESHGLPFFAFHCRTQYADDGWKVWVASIGGRGEV
jgi:hypothetical protein